MIPLLNVIAVGATGWLIASAIRGVRDVIVLRWQEIRRENMMPTIAALRHSKRHQSVLPLLEGMIDEVAVDEVLYEREGGHAQMELVLAWWARPRWVYRGRLRTKGKRLLEEGGHREVR